MSRKRTNWTASGEALFDALAAQGLPAGEIARRLSETGERGASRATVGRRLAERLGARRTGRAGNAAAGATVPPAAAVAEALDDAEDEPSPPPQSSPDVAAILSETEHPESATLQEINMWLERVNRAYIAAERDGNAAAIVALAGRAAALVDTRRKAAPPPPVDPNAFPDLVEAAERARYLLRAKLAAARSRATQ